MHLILVRHGIALDGYDDLNRPLTGRGIKRFEASAHRLRLLLAAEAPCLLWASHALRARQTAELIQRAMPVAGVAVHPWLYTGEFALLSRALHDHQGAAGIILVGHQPHLSLWTKALTGYDLAYRKGGFVMMDWQLYRAPQATLLHGYRVTAPGDGLPPFNP